MVRAHRSLRVGAILLVSVLIAVSSAVPESTAAIEDWHELTLRTVPALEGLSFRIGQTLARTDENGVLQIFVPEGAHQLEVLVPYVFGSVRVYSVFWSDRGITSILRRVDITGNTTILVGLYLEDRMSFQFMDSESNLLDYSQIGLMTLSDKYVGVYLQLHNFTDIWIPHSMWVNYRGKMTEVLAEYRVLNVTYRGSDVVFRSMQAFRPSPDSVVTVRTAVHTLRTRLVDAVFGTPVTATVAIALPNGEVMSTRADSEGWVSFAQVPRGDYSLKIEHSGVTQDLVIILAEQASFILPLFTLLDGLSLVAIALGVLGVVVEVRAFWNRQPNTKPDKEVVNENETPKEIGPSSGMIERVPVRVRLIKQRLCPCRMKYKHVGSAGEP